MRSVGIPYSSVEFPLRFESTRLQGALKTEGVFILAKVSEFFTLAASCSFPTCANGLTPIIRTEGSLFAIALSHEFRKGICPMGSHAKRIVARAFWLTTLLLGVVLLFGSLSPVSANTIGIAGESSRFRGPAPLALIPHQRVEIFSKTTRY